MINVVIAYDDIDADLGLYFVDGHNDLLANFPAGAVANNSLSGIQCTENFVANTVGTFNGNRFIFIALAHGNEEEVVASQVFVSSNNSSVFNNSFFYSCSCLTGHSLAHTLLANGCLAFIGYKNTVEVIEGYFQVFYTCQTFGIKSFLINEESIQASYDKMVKNYDQTIDLLVGGSMDDFIAASSLINNRDCMVILGNNNLTKADFLPN